MASILNLAETAISSIKQSVFNSPQPQPTGISVSAEEKQNIQTAAVQNAAPQPTIEVIQGAGGGSGGGGASTTWGGPEKLNSADTEKAKEEQQPLPKPSTETLNEKFDPIPNPLHKYSTYTYNLSLHILPITEYERMQKTGQYTVDNKRVLVASAGRHNDQTFARNPYWTEDFYFDNLKMTTVMGLNARTKGSNAITIDFAIIEPYGISFLDRLIKTCDDWPADDGGPIDNYIAVPYMLQIDFFGYDDDTHNPQWINFTTKHIPIRLLGMTTDFDAKGTVYKFSSVPYNHSAFTELHLNLPTNTNIKSTGTVESFFSENNAEVTELTNQVGTVQTNIRNLSIDQAVADKKQAYQNYQNQLAEWTKNNQSLVSTYQLQTQKFTEKARIPDDLVKSGYPTPIPPIPDDTTLKKQISDEYDKQASKNVVFATEVNASGLASALNSYQQFLKQEYELVGRPISYVFAFDDEIGKSKISTDALLDHTRKNMNKKDTDKAVTANQETPTAVDENDMLRTAAASAGTTQTQTTVSNNKNTGIQSKSFAVTPGQEINFNQGTSVIEIINSILKASSYIRDQIRANEEAAGLKDTYTDQKLAYDNYLKQLEDWKKTHPEIVNSNEWRSVGFTAGARIPDQLKNLGYPTPVPEPKPMSKEDQAKKQKIEREFEPYNHFKIIPKINLGPYDKIRNDYSRIVTFFVKKYQVRGVRFPDVQPGTRPKDVDCVKEYNYYFTGKNTDILDLKINFDTLFYTALTPRITRHQNSENKGAASEDRKEGQTAKDSSSSQNITAKHSKTWPASMQFVPNVAGANKMTQEQAEAMRANDLFGNLYSRSQADMLAIDMDIVGDPTYIQDEEFTLNPDRKADFLDKADLRLTNNQSLIINDGDLLIKLNFKMPLDIDTDKGLYKFDDPGLRKSLTDSSVFTGIYRIITIDNMFQNGQFKQKLQLVRLYNDPQTKDKENKTNAAANDPNRQDSGATDLAKPTSSPPSGSTTDASAEKASDGNLPSPPPLPVPGVPALPKQVQVSTASGAATTTIMGSDRIVTVTTNVSETVSGGGSTTTRAVIDPVTGKTTGYEVVKQAAEQVDRNALAAQADKLNSDEIERLQKANKNEAPISEGD